MMGIIKCRSVDDCFSNDITGNLHIKSLLSGKKFKKILRYLHLNDNEKKSNDPVFKVKKLVDLMNKKFKKYWVPNQKVAVDEAIVPTKSTTSGIRVYMKDKPDKWGIKIWKLVDSKKYLYEFQIYCGKKENQQVEHGLGPNVVRKLSATLPQGKPWMIYADNFFSTVELMEELYEKGTFFTGTIKGNRKRV